MESALPASVTQFNTLFKMINSYFDPTNEPEKPLHRVEFVVSFADYSLLDEDDFEEHAKVGLLELLKKSNYQIEHTTTIF